MMKVKEYLWVKGSSNWEEIWTFELPSNGLQMSNPVISEENGCFILATHEEIQVRSIYSSQILNTLPMPSSSSPHQVLLNTDDTAFTCFFSKKAEEHGLASSTTHFKLDASFQNPDRSLILPTNLPSTTGFSVLGYSEGSILIILRFNRFNYTYALIDSNCRVKYSLPLRHDFYNPLITNGWNPNTASLAEDGNALILTINNTLKKINL